MKYKVTPPWELNDQWTYGTVVLTLEVADLTDERGRTFIEGAWRVKKDGKVVKTFKGETAWSDSARLYGDLRFAELHRR